MSTPDSIAAKPLGEGMGLVFVFGTDHYGRSFSIGLDPMVLAESCPQMEAVCDRLLARGRHVDTREPRDEQLGQEAVS